MTSEDVSRIFQGLPLPVRAGMFVTSSLAHGHRVGKDSLGRPCLILEVEPTGARLPAQRLRHLEVLHAAPCIVSTNGSEQNLPAATVVVCCSEDRRVRSFFVRTVPEMVDVIGPRPTDRQCAATVAGLAELFAPAANGRSPQGLWAELLVIAESGNPVAAAGAWHPGAHDLFDFITGRGRLEVKSTVLPVRKHHFRLEQLRPNDGVEPTVLSVLLQPSGTGTSLQELADEVGGACPPEIRLKVQSELLAVETADARASEVRFDRVGARHSLLAFEASRIPTPTCPPGVSDVHFSADLSSAPSRAPALEEWFDSPVKVRS